MSYHYFSEEITDQQIEDFACKVRKKYKLNGQIEVIRFLELILSKSDPGTSIFIHEEGPSGGIDSITDVLADACVELRFDQNGKKNTVFHFLDTVYDGARLKRSEETFSVAHELGHYYLHTLGPGILNNEGRSKVREGNYHYKNIERQADRFALSFLAPLDQCVGLTVMQIRQLFGLSESRAKSRYREAKKLVTT